MHFCFRLFDRLIMTRSGSHPKRECVHHLRHIQNLERLPHGQSQRKIEQRLELLEVG